MRVSQIYQTLNDIITEITGEEEILAEDLTNIVDIGKRIFESTNVDNFVKKLFDQIGKIVYVDRKYKSRMPDLIFDSWEYGSILEKVRMETPDFIANDSWNLTNGNTYNQDIFYQPQIEVTLYNDRVTFECPISFAEDQVKSAFSGINQLNSFMSMIYTTITNGIDIATDALIMRAINNFINTTYMTRSRTPATYVNVLSMYNTLTSQTLTFPNCLHDPSFTRFAVYTMDKYLTHMTAPTKVLNIAQSLKFTNKEDLKLLLLSDFASASKVYLESDTFHNELVSLTGYTPIPFWQAVRDSDVLDTTSCATITCESYNPISGESEENTIRGIIGVAFDKNALGVSNLQRKTTTHYNAKGDFYNNYFKSIMGLFNDWSEQFIVFVCQ